MEVPVEERAASELWKFRLWGAFTLGFGLAVLVAFFLVSNSNYRQTYSSFNVSAVSVVEQPQKQCVEMWSQPDGEFSFFKRPCVSDFYSNCVPLHYQGRLIENVTVTTFFNSVGVDHLEDQCWYKLN